MKMRKRNNLIIKILLCSKILSKYDNRINKFMYFEIGILINISFKRGFGVLGFWGFGFRV